MIGGSRKYRQPFNLSTLLLLSEVSPKGHKPRLEPVTHLATGRRANKQAKPQS